jgi:hypothetical protein
MRVAFACLLAASVASAQTAQVDGSIGRVRLGPVLLTPKLALTNMGVDNNVFNQADAEHPSADFTMTVTPHLDWQLRAGRALLTGALNEDLVYYRRFADERSANLGLTGAFKVPLNRVTLAVDRSYRSVRDRPGFEIDARSQHTEDAYGSSFELRALSKTVVGITGRRSTVRFDHDATFQGSSLWRELDRTMTTAGVLVRYRLTPLTGVTLNVEREEDRFLVSQVRDSNSVGVMVGVRFDPSALISGSATFGHRTFKMLTGEVPGYDGPIAKVDLTCVALGGTMLALALERNIQYSYDFEQPYYVQTGVSGSVMQRLFGPIDLTGRAGVQQLAYRGQIGIAIPLADRTDSVHSLGGTVSYRVAKTMRIGFNVDHQSRTSIEAQREYGGLRYGISVTYGS